MADWAARNDLGHMMDQIHARVGDAEHFAHVENADGMVRSLKQARDQIDEILGSAPKKHQTMQEARVVPLSVIPASPRAPRRDQEQAVLS